MNDFDVKIGTYTEYQESIKVLAQLHADEAMVPGADFNVDINEDLYKAMEMMNKHLGIVILDNNILVGYLSIFMYEHHHYRGHKFAQTDAFFTLPESRGMRSYKAIRKAFDLAKTILKEKYDIEYLYMGSSPTNNLKFLADAEGFQYASTFYVKRL